MSSMKKHRASVELAIERALDSFPGHDWVVATNAWTGGTHMRFELVERKSGVSTCVVCSCSPSDHRAVMNITTTAKRSMREALERVKA